MIHEYKVARHAHTRAAGERMFVDPKEAIKRAKDANRGLKVYRREQGKWVLYWSE